MSQATDRQDSPSGSPEAVAVAEADRSVAVGARRRPVMAAVGPIAAAAGPPLLALVVVVAGWKAYVAWFDVSPFLLPPPDDVWRALVDLVGQGDTWRHVRVTAQEVVGGFLLAAGAGVLTGIVLAEAPPVERAVTPLLVALQVMPKVAIIPVLLLWFGSGTSSKLAVAAVFAYFPITIGTLSALRAIEAGHRDLAQVLGATRSQRLRFIDLPGAMPGIFTGMEIGIVLATVGGVVAEYLAGAEGLGWMIVRSLNQVRVDDLYAVIVLLSALGLILYLAITRLRRLVTPADPSSPSSVFPG